jgi:hypothetical protein
MFREAVGMDPHQDDLQRCNCPQAGKPHHAGCRWNKTVSLPCFIVSPFAPEAEQRKQAADHHAYIEHMAERIATEDPAP